MSKILLYFIIILISILSFQNMNAQVDSLSESDNIAAFIYLDSFVVSASKKGFDVKDFIDMVQADESFYEAFKNIRFLSYRSDNEIIMFDKKNRQKAFYSNRIRQTSIDKCRTMKILKEESSGDFFKSSKRHRYYTGKLHERLFHTKGRQCEDKNLNMNSVEPSSRMEKYVAELKKLIFAPGTATDVPLLGDKTAIFDKKMIPYYNYAIKSEKYLGELDCYVFSIKVKPNIGNNKTVIKNLETYFDKETFQVVARNYTLTYSTLIYDFDVTMNVKLKKWGDTYVPEYIQYDGNWDIPGKKPEIAKFKISFVNYEGSL